MAELRWTTEALDWLEDKGDLRTSTLQLLSTLGYASNKTVNWPTEPKAFSEELDALLGGSNRLNAEAACLADWLRDELVALLKAEHMLRDPGDADRMAAWDPFDQNRHADFFDPEWMFGFSRGFDVLIGNPPYVRQEAIKDDKPRYKPHYDCYNGTADLYVYFYERSIQLLNPYGCLSFITSNKWFRAKYGADLRRYMTTHTEMRQIIDFGDEAVFDALA
ncbi:MAG: Eco57I restriction-modification methylase domain-containing protein [Betaproteobacteria bacterium]|nr:Eco57I restriction-modification methylase domain-containing protein [Betaproteobacteria bacterium]